MIHSVRIDGYRALSHFSMSGLGQINLLVGKNNSAKTSVLEALYLLATGGDPTALWKVMARRGEQLFPDPNTGRNPQQELDICHMFYGHEIKLGVSASVATANQSPARSITFKIVEAKREENPALFAQIPPETDGPLGSRLAMSVTGTPNPLAPLVPLSSRGGLRPETFQLLSNIAASAPRVDATSPQYISTESLTVPELSAAFNTISLTPHEDRVLRAIQILEPKIERIAPAPLGNVYFPGFPARGGFKVKLKDLEQPIPIGSMGEGTWRMLALAMTLSRSKDSLLLIDEIDTGLHYTVMARMWKLLADAAKDLKVQVFATTHSSDCVKSLASICRDNVRVGSDVTIQRLEIGGTKAIPYSEAEIKTIAEDNIEVR